QSDDPMAYRWHCQHHNIVRLGTLTQVVRDMNPTPSKERPGASQQFASGRERILAARKAAQQAQTLKALNEELASVEELAPASASKPQANPSKTTGASMPTNAPTTSPKPSEQTTVNPTSHPCVTVSPWPAASVHTLPKASLNRPRPTPGHANPAQAAKPSPRWDDAEASNPPNDGKTPHIRTTKKQLGPH